jgi:hypothetical protein
LQVRGRGRIFRNYAVGTVLTTAQRRRTVVKNLTPMPVHTSVFHTSVAPMSAAQGTAVSSTGQASAYARGFIGLDVTADTDANPGSPPREAPV